MILFTIDRASGAKDFKEINNMSKSGRYAADRKKVESVTATTKTVEVSDCGTLFIMDTAAAACTYTLPKADDAGKGWWCKFIVGVDNNDCDHVIQINSGDSDNMHVLGFSLQGGNLEEPTEAQQQTGSTSSPMKKLTLEGANSEIGDQYEIVCDGSRWFLTSFTSGSAAFAMVAT